MFRYASADTAGPSDVRLPGAVVPSAYQLRLTPDLSSFTFEGEVAVSIELCAPTREITLNAIELEIKDALIRQEDGEPVSGEASFDPAKETVTITFPNGLRPGHATLWMSFSGILNDRLRGFYRSAYVDGDGRECHLASTQFEPTDARRAFPCWDEPELKASFSVTMVVPEHLSAMSNMPEESVATENGKKVVRFAETPPMSTYLLAFAVGDFSCVSERSASGTLMRVWATTGNEDRGRFALDVSLRLLDYFDDYFGIPYPLPKLDHVAIPDFAAGAMENWGCITYREPALLVDPESSSSGTRQLVAEIVSHEMAHMWFGDLVTMSWWNDLWLNESFASWMGDKAVDALYPEWSKWDQFLVQETSRAMRLDGLRNSHPIEQEVGDPAEIGQLFDSISYSKGASVIRMLEAYLGEEPFREGINLYLRRHELANATTADLWVALAEASGQPVTEVMDSWTRQTGYPYLNVGVERGEDGASVSMTQRRFAYEAILAEDREDETLWRIPVSIASQDGPQASELVTGRTAEISVPASGNWLKVNPGQTGFYRVMYESEELGRLADAVESGELSPADRLGIAEDAFALCRAGMLPAHDFLDLARRYKGETDQSVWANLTGSLGSVDLLIEGDDGHEQFRAFARDLLGPIYAQVGWTPAEGEGHLSALLRANVLSALGTFGDQAVLDEACGQFERYLERPSLVPPDLRSVMFVLSARAGDERTYETMWDLHAAEQLQEEKVRLLSALTQFPEAELIDETLSRSFTDRVRSHEAIGVIVRTAATRMGRELAWQFLRDNWQEVDRRYGEGGFGLMYIVEITSGFSSGDRLTEVEEFFTDNPTPAAERTVRQCLEKIRLNMAWLDKNRPGLSEWLKQP